ncbi:protein S40-7-like [Syzygium oleosum]|uniref:protein S40-7-like n=1 Tax=Syzygium oleosum TaxID=219896 RepID=UPI0011D21059|nr:protein S40-7-like [Syzygium oleosum]
MEPTGFRHRRSPSGDRFLGAFSFSPTPGSAFPPGGVGGGGGGGGGDELNEAEVCFSGDFPEPRARHRSALSSSSSSDAALWAPRGGRRHLLTGQLQGNGILAALHGGGAAPASNVVIPSMSSSSSSSPSKPVPPTAPRRHPGAQEREYSQSVPCGKFQQSSAPMNVPAPLAAMPKQGRNRFFEVDNDFEDDEMLPPHEIVARGSGMSPRTTFSVLEGAGRTLKGRDLRQVRNAIWRQTGFLD